MTKIRIRIVTARESLAPGHVPFYTITCTGCGHDDSVSAVSSDWPRLSDLFDAAYTRAESMYFDHLTGTGHTSLRVCPIMLFDSEEWEKRIDPYAGRYNVDDEEDDEPEDPRQSGWPLVGAALDTIKVLTNTIAVLTDNKETA